MPWCEQLLAKVGQEFLHTQEETEHSKVEHFSVSKTSGLLLRQIPERIPDSIYQLLATEVISQE